MRTLNSCFDLIGFHQQCIPGSPPLEVEPATPECRNRNSTSGPPVHATQNIYIVGVSRCSIYKRPNEAVFEKKSQYKFYRLKKNSNSFKFKGYSLIGRDVARRFIVTYFHASALCFVKLNIYTDNSLSFICHLCWRSKIRTTIFRDF